MYAYICCEELESDDNDITWMRIKVASVEINEDSGQADDMILDSIVNYYYEGVYGSVESAEVYMSDNLDSDNIVTHLTGVTI